MAGLVSDQQSSPGLAALGSDAFPSTFGERVDPLETLRMLGRASLYSQSEFGSVDEFGRQITAPEPFVDPETLNQQAGIKGPTPESSLTFTSPLPLSVARDMNEAKRAENLRADAAARSPGGVGSGGADVLYGMLDPVGIGAALLPVFGEARMAAALGRAGIDLSGSFAGRTALRAATGAVDAATANVPLVGLRYGLSQQEQADYTMHDAAMDLVSGAALGGVLHPLGGAIGEASSAIGGAIRGRGAPEASPNLAEPAAAAAAPPPLVVPPEANQAAMQAAVAAVAEDRPADVTPIIKRMPVPDEPLGLADYLHSLGGVQDKGGDIRSMLGGAMYRPGLVNYEGMALDDATLRAHQAGYLPEFVGDSRPAVNDLLDALSDDLSGLAPRYSHFDQHIVEDRAAALTHNAALDRAFSSDDLDEMFGAGRSAEQGAPPVPGGMVRFFHGGDNPTSGGARWVTQDPVYARDFRGPNAVHYVDVAADHPAVVDAADEHMPGRYAHFEVPGDVAAGFKPYLMRAAPDTQAVSRAIGEPSPAEAATLRQVAEATKAPPVREGVVPPDLAKEIEQLRGEIERAPSAREGATSQETSPVERVYRAYLDATGGKTNVPAGLEAIRAKLADMPRAEQDAALRELTKGGNAGLLPQDDATQITSEAKAAAFSAGGKPRHLFWVDKPLDLAKPDTETAAELESIAAVEKASQARQNALAQAAACIARGMV